MLDGEWFRGASRYWKDVDATVDGMLGGLGMLHYADVRDSRRFLNRLFKSTPRRRKGLALDVGAGIGRVSEHVLLPYFEQVALLEANERFVSEARRVLAGKLHHAYNCRLQEFTPRDAEEEGAYDLVWMQWVLMYASDVELIAFLQQAKRLLTPSGLIGIKENILAADQSPTVDTDDCSIIRSDANFKWIFAQAGLQLVDEAMQTGFPPHLYPVRMYMLRPLTPSTSPSRPDKSPTLP